MNSKDLQRLSETTVRSHAYDIVLSELRNRRQDHLERAWELNRQIAARPNTRGPYPIKNQPSNR